MCIVIFLLHAKLTLPIGEMRVKFCMNLFREERVTMVPFV